MSESPEMPYGYVRLAEAMAGTGVPAGSWHYWAKKAGVRITTKYVLLWVRQRNVKVQVVTLDEAKLMVEAYKARRVKP